VRSRRTGLWLGILLLALGSLAIVLIPAILIRPFAPQTPQTIAISFALRRWSPLVTLGALLAAILLIVRFWRSGPRLFGRIGIVAVALPIALAAWLARQNHFEWMFAPIPDARFVRAGAAAFVQPSDMVLAVTRGADAVAYPVPQLAYHHVVEDMVGGVPIVATY
jgi:hypothetical protein